MSTRRLPGIIRGFNESVGGVNSDSEGYHETITRVFLRGVRLFLAGADPEAPLHALVNAMLRFANGPARLAAALLFARAAVLGRGAAEFYPAGPRRTALIRRRGARARPRARREARCPPRSRPCAHARSACCQWPTVSLWTGQPRSRRALAIAASRLARMLPSMRIIRGPPCAGRNVGDHARGRRCRDGRWHG